MLSNTLNRNAAIKAFKTGLRTEEQINLKRQLTGDSEVLFVLFSKSNLCSLNRNLSWIINDDLFVKDLFDRLQKETQIRSLVFVDVLIWYSFFFFNRAKRQIMFSCIQISCFARKKYVCFLKLGKLLITSAIVKVGCLAIQIYS
jgi:hypothetical protein